MNAVVTATIPPVVYRVLRTPGRPLDPAARAEMEACFGRDFSRVRVHTGALAAASARAVNADAYTVGGHVVSGFASRDGKAWEVLDRENYNAVQAAATGEVWAVGPKGRIATLGK